MVHCAIKSRTITCNKNSELFKNDLVVDYQGILPCKSLNFCYFLFCEKFRKKSNKKLIKKSAVNDEEKENPFTLWNEAK